MARVLKQNWVRLGYSLVEQPFPRPWSRAHWPGNRPTWQGGAFRGRQPPRRPWQSPRSLVRIPLWFHGVAKLCFCVSLLQCDCRSASPDPRCSQVRSPVRGGRMFSCFFSPFFFVVPEGEHQPAALLCGSGALLVSRTYAAGQS